MKSTPSGDSLAGDRSAQASAGPILDAKIYIEHDPTIGYHYTPSFRRNLPKPGGGEYTLATNSAGIRSEREYAKEKPQGVFRIVVLGDSFAAGQYVSNDQRFTEILERRLAPNVEVLNFALEGTGTDQQLLIFETVAREYDPDLVIIFPFLQNIRRNLADARISYDPATMKPILLAKPRFELMPDGQLELRNVPVSKERKSPEESGEGGTKTDIDRSLKHRIKVKLSGWRAVAIAKKFVYAMKPWEPFAEYKTSHTPGWRLMEAILRRLKESAKGKPVVIVPVFYASYVQYRMRNYWDRFNSLTTTPGIHTIDLLPDFKRLGREATACFQEPFDPHYSTRGHLVVADVLERELRQRGLLK